jgi:VWFA-related protein
LATATGGLAFFPEDVSDVDRIARQVAREIRDQYTIEYSPTNTAMDGSYRHIRITVDAPGIAAVRTRAGYYAGEVPAKAPTRKTSQR